MDVIIIVFITIVTRGNSLIIYYSLNGKQHKEIGNEEKENKLVAQRIHNNK